MTKEEYSVYNNTEKAKQLIHEIVINEYKSDYTSNPEIDGALEAIREVFASFQEKRKVLGVAI